MTIAAVITAKTKDIGGFDVRRALPAIERRMVGPFVFLDQMGPARIAAGRGLDVRPHPHIGLSTMTYLYEGEIRHRDSLGTVQDIRPGEVNWMCAGRGIVHSERSPTELRRHAQTLSGIQFWVGLPKSLEESEPSFLHLASDALPVLAADGARVHLIAGSMFGEASPLVAPHPMICADIQLDHNAVWPIPADWTERALYIAAGSVEIGNAQFSMGQLLVLEMGREVEIRTEHGARLMLLGGEPMDGPRHMWWNFVSSSKDRIEQAKEDWKQRRFAAVPEESEFIPLPE